MTNPQAGWYPDPSGDTSRIRYWNGTAWTNEFAPAQSAPSAAPEQQATAQPNQQQSAYAAQTTQTPQATPYATQQQGYGANPGYGTNTACQPNTVLYQVSDQDRTLRLIAFIFVLISTVSTCWLIIPLAWMIPFSIFSYKTYKGERANTTTFGVLVLIFCSLVGGILLLVSNKEA